jgi:UDP-GlcNAc3NAcA epimerase
MKIITIIGARPQFIKASVVTAAIASTPGLKEIVIHTGQHFDANMSDIFFAELNMDKPDYSLDIHSGGHGNMTGRMLIEIEKVLQQERPDAVLVYGDTNSTLAGALAAAKLQIPVAHIEAGLRSCNMVMPEEINRILTDRISHWLFAPTHTAVENLVREGFAREQINLVGDVMYDVALHYGARVQAGAGQMARLGLKEKSYILATIHRAENTDDPRRLGIIVEAMIAAAKILPVVWPIHPRTRAVLQRAGSLETLTSAVNLIEPVGYLDMVRLEKYAALIATDSGGVQKEAFFYGVPCVTIRHETEWVELLEAGWNRLAPPVDVQSILQVLQVALGSQGRDFEPYGAGDAADQIVKRLMVGI